MTAMQTKTTKPQEGTDNRPRVTVRSRRTETGVERIYRVNGRAFSSADEVTAVLGGVANGE